MKKLFIYPIFIATLLTFCSLNAVAQQTLINVNGWNAYVHLPDDYAANPTRYYPTIIFFPGVGEAGTNASLVIANGPGAYIAQGWNGNIGSTKFIVISLQIAVPFQGGIEIVKDKVDKLRTLYRIGDLTLTGLSMGGHYSYWYATTYPSEVNRIVTVEGQTFNRSGDWHTSYQPFAGSGMKALIFEQVNDKRGNDQSANAINYWSPGAAWYILTNFGGGGHCCWNEFYGGQGKQPGVFNIFGENQTLYDWIAKSIPSDDGDPSPNKAPTATAGSDVTITLPTSTTKLTGSGSDEDGTIASYKWTKTSGPSSYTIVNPNAATTDANGLTEGVYQFQLTVTDNKGATATATMKVTVNAAPNKAPTATAGSDVTITLPTNTAKLTGSGTDEDGTIASYQWTKTSGPSSYTIVNPNAATTDVNGLTEGVYQFQLTVTDNKGATATATMKVTVNAAPNKAPTATAGSDVTITLPTSTAKLTGSGSDEDGTIASYKWTKTSGPSSYTIVNPNAATTDVNGLTEGVYQFQLTVTDNKGATATATMKVTVNAAENKAPTATAGSDVTITLPTNTAKLTGSGSDEDGTIASYKWTKTSGPSSYTIVNPNAATTDVNGLTEGVYQFQLTVTDNKGATATATMKVTVNAAPNKAPTATAGSDVTITLPTSTAKLTGSGSDEDGTIASYKWTKTSGPSSYTIVNPNAATTDVNGLTEGAYQFQLTVTDNKGATATATMKVTVNAAPNKAPTATAGSDVTITLPTSTVKLTGSGSDEDGTIASYKWTKTSGPSSYTLTNPNSATTDVNGLTEGVYQFQLTVTDNKGATATATMKVTVNAAANKAPTVTVAKDVVITLPVSSASLAGSGNDEDGTIVSYKWTKVSGPNNFSIVNPNSATTDVNGLTEGVYQFQLTVTDNKGATATATMKVTVNAAANKAPTVTVAKDVVITLPVSTASLAGSGNDEDGTIVSYKWTKVSGPNNFSIVNANSAVTDVNGLTEGVYQFQLTVTDNKGATATATMKVTVNAAPNKAPTATAGSDVTITLPTSTAKLTGSGSDEDGTIASYKWTKTSGPSSYALTNPNAATTDVNGLTEGVYQFQLTVTDNKGATATATMKVTVNAAPNKAPTVTVAKDVVITLPVSSASLAGSGSDEDGTIVSYKWTKVSGPNNFSIVNANSAVTDVNGLTEGVYQFQLTVTDNKGATATATMKVTVNAAANKAPTVTVAKDVVITLPESTASLAGSGNDEDGTIVSYKWTKVSGPNNFSIVNANSAVTDVNGLTQGEYQFRLTVTDNKGATAYASMKITVNSAPNKAPVANAGSNISITLPTNSVTLKGSGTDPDGQVTSYQWTKVSGPANFSIVNPANGSSNVTGLIEGTYTFRLKVTDDKGASATSDVKVSVLPGNKAPVVDAGADISITLPVTTVLLAGKASDDDGNVAGYNWKQISGPSDARIVSLDSAETTVEELMGGTYRFVLSATDNGGAVGTDTVSVTVNVPRLSSFNAGVRVYPNPVQERAEVEVIGAGGQMRMELSVVSINGRVVMKKDLVTDKQKVYTESLDLSRLQRGIYIVVLRSQNGKLMASKKIVKMK